MDMLHLPAMSRCRELTQHELLRSCCAMAISQACASKPHSSTLQKEGSIAPVARTSLVHRLK
jgi:hypothetical protein